MQRAKWTSHKFNSFINSVNYCLTFRANDLDFFGLSARLISMGNNAATKQFWLLALTLSINGGTSSLFLSLNPWIEYSTSFAVCRTMKDGLLGILGRRNSGDSLWTLRIDYSMVSSLPLSWQLSSRISKIPIGYLSNKSMTAALSVNFIYPQCSLRPSFSKTVSSWTQFIYKYPLEHVCDIQLMQLLVCVVDHQLLEPIYIKNFETIYI